jgi:hypothetical protein
VPRCDTCEGLTVLLGFGFFLFAPPLLSPVGFNTGAAPGEDFLQGWVLVAGHGFSIMREAGRARQPMEKS